MEGTKINLEKISNGWILTVEEPYDTHSGLVIPPVYFPTLKEAFDYLQKHIGNQ